MMARNMRVATSARDRNEPWTLGMSGFGVFRGVHDDNQVRGAGGAPVPPSVAQAPPTLVSSTNPPAAAATSVPIATVTATAAVQPTVIVNWTK